MKGMLSGKRSAMEKKFRGAWAPMQDTELVGVHKGGKNGLAANSADSEEPCL